MATVAIKPTAPHQQKMKRPPLPAVQTSIPPSQSSPSPSLSSKRPPSGFKAPPTPTVNGVNGTMNGAGPRISQRKRDSVKPGDVSRNRNGKDAERRSVKRVPEPFGMYSLVMPLLCKPRRPDHTYSQEFGLHLEKIPQQASIIDHTLKSDEFPIRSTRWQFPLQSRYEDPPGASENADNTT